MSLLMSRDTELEMVKPVYDDKDELVDIIFVVRTYRFEGFFKEEISLNESLPIVGLQLIDIESLINYFREIKTPVNVYGLLD